MSGHCPKCGVFHEEDDARPCSACAATSQHTGPAAPGSNKEGFMPESRINVGDKVRDMVTGFTGIVTARAQYLNGNRRAMVEAAATDGGTRVASDWYDEQRLVVVEAGAVKPDDVAIPSQAA